MVYPKTRKENEMPVAYQRPGTYPSRFVCNTVIPFWNFNEFRAIKQCFLTFTHPAGRYLTVCL